MYNYDVKFKKTNENVIKKKFLRTFFSKIFIKKIQFFSNYKNNHYLIKFLFNNKIIFFP